MPSRQRTWPPSRLTANVSLMSACPGQRPPSSLTAAADPAGGSLEQSCELCPEVAGVRSGTCAVEGRQQVGPDGAAVAQPPQEVSDAAPTGRPRRRDRRSGRPRCRRRTGRPRKRCRRPARPRSPYPRRVPKLGCSPRHLRGSDRWESPVVVKLVDVDHVAVASRVCDARHCYLRRNQCRSCRRRRSRTRRSALP